MFNRKIKNKNYEETDSDNLNKVENFYSDFSYLLEQLEQLVQQFNEISYIAVQKFQNIYTLAQPHFTELEFNASIQELHETIQNQNEEKSKVIEENETLNQQILALQEKEHTLQNSLLEKETTIKQLKAQEQNFSGLLEENETLNQQILALQEKEHTLQNSLLEKETTIEQLKAQEQNFSGLLEENETLNQQILALQEKEHTLQNSLLEKETTIEQLKAQEQNFSGLLEENETLNQQILALQEKEHTLQNSLLEKETTIEQLKAQEQNFSGFVEENETLNRQILALQEKEYTLQNSLLEKETTIEQLKAQEQNFSGLLEENETLNRQILELLEQQKKQASKSFMSQRETKKKLINSAKENERLFNENKKLKEQLEEYPIHIRFLEQRNQQLTKEISETDKRHNEMLQILNENLRDKPGTTKSSDLVPIDDISQKLQYYKIQLFLDTSECLWSNYLESYPQAENQRKLISAKIRSLLAEMIFNPTLNNNTKRIVQRLEDILELKLHPDTKERIVQLIREAQELLNLIGSTDPPGELFFGTINTNYDPSLQQPIIGSEEDGYIIYITFPGFQVGDRILIKADVFVSSNKTKQD
ncbi:MAG: hypothetical protein H6669_02275 [Ardenticatenaceae bacterium]|nr:hypothetical protein [Ardenticatenaceae bacterium]